MASTAEGVPQTLGLPDGGGARRWLEPRIAAGRFLSRRTVVGYALIALFTVLPHVTIAGKPAILLDVLHRRFTILGTTFLPTDTVLLVLLLLIVLFSIFLVTALFGRLWCGWGCPQTVYLELVYRPIERLFHGTAGVGGKARSALPLARRAAKWLTYAAISLALAHTFLSYFVGVGPLLHWMAGSPLQHPIAFLVVALTTGLMLWNFGYFREQTCLIACPYGRLQSTLLDKSSLIIGYDRRRGEPRGKGKREPRSAGGPTGAVLPVVAAESPALGDCVDCNACVSVCPTGIDIRNGLQMECIGCAQCIDACDAIMDKVNLPRGLVRYGTAAAIEGAEGRLLRPRTIIYPLLLAALVSVFVTVLARRPLVDLSVVRAPGSPFSVLRDERIASAWKLRITNRTPEPRVYHLEAAAPEGLKIEREDGELRLEPAESIVLPIGVTAPQAAFSHGKLEATVRVRDDLGRTQEAKIRLLGPESPRRAPHPEAAPPAATGTGAIPTSPETPK